MANTKNSIYKQTAIGLIPTDWEVKAVGDVCDFIVPGRNKPKLFDGEIPWITTPDLLNKTIVYDSKINLKISKEEAKEVGSKIAPKNSIIMSCVGELGLLAIAGNDLVINQQLHAFIPKEKINYQFLFYALNIQKKYMDRVATKTAVPYLNKDNCNSIPIPLPPLPEQKAIAHILGLMDAAIDTNNQLIAQKQQRKNWLMQNLLTGKKRLKGFSEEWKEVRLIDVLISFQNGYAFSADSYCKVGIPIITMGQISLEGVFQFDYEKVNYWNEKHIAGLQNYILKKGDLIIAMTDVTPQKNLIGRMAIVDLDGTFLLNQRVGLLRLNKEKANATFIAALSGMKNWRDYSKSVATLGVQANMGTTEIKSGKINLPSLKEQTAIAQILQAADKEIQLLKAKTDKIKEQKKGLMQVLLTGKKRLKI